MIAALVSSFREGPLFVSTLRSALALDYVLVDDSALEGVDVHAGEPTPVDAFRTMGHVEVMSRRTAKSDASKRTRMLRRMKDVYKARRKGVPRRELDPLWILWLDGDELLLWGEYLPDLTHRADAETGAGGHRLRLVELDGSVVFCYGKLVRGDRIRRYLESSYQVELETGMIIALPNIPICGPGGIPAFTDEQSELPQAERVRLLAELRPPLAGEPHLLHRSIMRDPSRTIERLHAREPAFYEEAMPEVPFESSKKTYSVEVPNR